MKNWECPICGYEADNNDLQQEHMKSMSDNAHTELLKEQTKNKTLDVKDEAGDAWDETKGKIDEIASNVRSQF